MPGAARSDAVGVVRRSVGAPEERSAQPFTFVRPDRFDPQAVRSLEAAHEIFTRRVANAWGATLRGVVNLELAAVDQVTYDDYVRSLPTPALIAMVNLAPLPGPMLIDCNIELALQLLDRLLGSGGDTEPAITPRRPTDLESAVMADLIQRVVPAVQETLAGFAQVQGELVGLEYNAQLVQAVPPADNVLLFTFLVRATQGFKADGMLTLCYPSAAAGALVDYISAALDRDVPEDQVDEDWRGTLHSNLGEVQVELRITLDDTAVPACDLAALAVGDVLRLDHRVDHPVRGVVESREVLTGHLGRRGRRLGVQVSTPPTLTLAHARDRSNA